ncbi:hypothetical protein F0562_026192 [Nyssa sinensis]|uniref:Uncharacterized protein n=1 Tax=Nyssa sinensis TaxID=561372 RepID=A0A5J5BAJ2_9ASTE|nr:hypothetical protein F0562_026192 [Nyssa sinensis]
MSVLLICTIQPKSCTSFSTFGGCLKLVVELQSRSNGANSSSFSFWADLKEFIDFLESQLWQLREYFSFHYYITFQAMKVLLYFSQVFY